MSGPEQVAPAPTRASNAPHVLAAIHAVSNDLAQIGISKDRRNKEQGFDFRGIDQVMNVLAPLLVKHNLLVIPRFFDRIVTERTTASGKTAFNVVLRGEFHFVSVLDGTEVVANTVGEGQDMGDKATNKAMAIAYKYAMFQTFCVPLEASADPDASTPEESASSRDPTKGTLQDLVDEFDLRSLEAANLKELADLFGAAQTTIKTAAIQRECTKSVLVDALGALTKAKDKAKERLSKPATPEKPAGGKKAAAPPPSEPRGDEPGGPLDPTQEAT